MKFRLKKYFVKRKNNPKIDKRIMSKKIESDIIAKIKNIFRLQK